MISYFMLTPMAFQKALVFFYCHATISLYNLKYKKWRGQCGHFPRIMTELWLWIRVCSSRMYPHRTFYSYLIRILVRSAVVRCEIVVLDQYQPHSVVSLSNSCLPDDLLTDQSSPNSDEQAQVKLSSVAPNLTMNFLSTSLPHMETDTVTHGSVSFAETRPTGSGMTMRSDWSLAYDNRTNPAVAFLGLPAHAALADRMSTWISNQSAPQTGPFSITWPGRLRPESTTINFGWTPKFEAFLVLLARCNAFVPLYSGLFHGHPTSSSNISYDLWDAARCEGSFIYKVDLY